MKLDTTSPKMAMMLIEVIAFALLCVVSSSHFGMADGARITMMTAENTYTLYGTYEPTSPSASDQFYYMNINGNLSLGNDGIVTVGAFRWIMRVENKFGSGSSAAYARRIIIYDGESETTGVNEVREADGVSGDRWYTLDGHRLSQKPSRAGVYIYKGVKVAIK